MKVLIQKSEEDTVSALTEEQMLTTGQPKNPTKEWSCECLEYMKVSENPPLTWPHKIQTWDTKSLGLSLH